MRFAIVEDDKAVSDELRQIAESLGHHASAFASAKPFLAALRRETFDLVLLDWHLPDGSGIEILRHLRSSVSATLPVLFITANSAEAAVIEGLTAGADDYITKPAAKAIVVARISALLRRAYAGAAVAEVETFGPYEFHPAIERVKQDGTPVELTSKEFHLALTLFRNRSRALSRTYLMEAVWGQSADVPSRTLDVHLSHVRRKLGLQPANGYRLITVYGYGYRLEPSLPEHPLPESAPPEPSLYD
jgi:DNA-binding response OmpR family regulator